MNVPMFDFEDEILADAWADVFAEDVSPAFVDDIRADAATIAQFDNELASAETLDDLMTLLLEFFLFSGSSQYWGDFYSRELLERSGKYEKVLADYPDADYFRSDAKGDLCGVDDEDIKSKFPKMKRDVAVAFCRSYLNEESFWIV